MFQRNHWLPFCVILMKCDFSISHLQFQSSSGVFMQSQVIQRKQTNSTSSHFSFDLFGTVLHCEQNSSTGKLSWSSSLQRYGNSLCSLHKSPLDLGWVSLVKSHKWRLKCTFLDRVISYGHGGNVDVSALLSSKNVNRYFTCCQMGLTPLAHWRAVAAASGSQVL